ncbi:hypothetical protein [Spirillospora albida]|uniref:hypothetical protein n=1 Tax=Spirillospora albida TaxID=58123 RepID=UPI0004C21DE5|nr:hypothetical protein [Spirillospora albida]
MADDPGPGADAGRPRPSFLPPEQGPPPAAGAHTAPAAAPPRSGGAWGIAMILTATALLVSAFLPWARAEMVVELLGRPVTRDLGSLAGIEADGLVLAVPVLAVVAIGLAFWDTVVRDARVGSLAAVPGALALLACGLFVLRLGDVRDNAPGLGLEVGYRITVRYGWYAAVGASLALMAIALARPLADRLTRTGQS